MGYLKSYNASQGDYIIPITSNGITFNVAYYDVANNKMYMIEHYSEWVEREYNISNSDALIEGLE